MSFVSVTLSIVCAMMLLANSNALPIQQVITSASETATSSTSSFDSQLYSTTNEALDYTSTDNLSSYTDYTSDVISQQAIDNYIKSQQNIDQTAEYIAQQQYQQQQSSLDLAQYPNGPLNPLDNELYTQTLNEMNYDAEQTIYNNINLDYSNSSSSDSDSSS